MSGAEVQITTDDGTARAYFYAPQGAGPWPAVILFMDGIGIRPAMREMAQQLSATGHVILLPDLYYRSGRYGPFDAKKAFAGAEERQQVMALHDALTQDMVRRDTGAFLDYLSGRSDVRGRAGCVGYCMGGRCALTAAGSYPERIAAAASFHGGGLATESADSPHRLLHAVKAKVYIGVAGIDPYFGGEEEGRLAAALRQGEVDHTIETYAGVHHGFAVMDTPVYNAAASNRHWARLAALFDEALR